MNCAIITLKSFYCWLEVIADKHAPAKLTNSNKVWQILLKHCSSHCVFLTVANYSQSCLLLPYNYCNPIAMIDTSQQMPINNTFTSVAWLKGGSDMMLSLFSVLQSCVIMWSTALVICKPEQCFKALLFCLHSITGCYISTAVCSHNSCLNFTKQIKVQS